MDLSDLKNLSSTVEQIEEASEQLGRIRRLLNTEAVRTLVFAALAVAAIASFVIVYVRTGDLVAAGAAPAALLAAVAPAVEKARDLVWSSQSHDIEVAEVIASVPDQAMIDQLRDAYGE